MDEPSTTPLEYKSNPKHSEPWQRGRRGSLCPKEVRPLAQKLLDASVQVGAQRYAIHEGRAYCAQEYAPGTWHGYPVGWKQVPHALRAAWIKEDSVRKRDKKRNWD